MSLFSGNGYCRSEAVVVVLLTKKSMAKRVYATIVNAGSNTDGFKEQGESLSLKTEIPTELLSLQSLSSKKGYCGFSLH